MRFLDLYKNQTNQKSKPKRLLLSGSSWVYNSAFKKYLRVKDSIFKQTLNELCEPATYKLYSVKQANNLVEKNLSLRILVFKHLSEFFVKEGYIPQKLYSLRK